MRISDWSSDVCSSDLSFPLLPFVLSRAELVEVPYRSTVPHPPFDTPLRQAQGLLRANGGRVSPHARHSPDGAAGGPVQGASRRFACRRPVSRDRKSVVSGKSVSVRVDLGGGRIIKKKNQ